MALVLLEDWTARLVARLVARLMAELTRNVGQVLSQPSYRLTLEWQTASLLLQHHPTGALCGLHLPALQALAPIPAAHAYRPVELR